MTALRAVLIPGLILGLILGLTPDLFRAAAPARAEDPDPRSPLEPGRPGAAGRRTPIVAAIEKARPAVVSVYARTPGRSQPFAGDPFADDFFRRFFGDPGPGLARPATSLGSGVIIDGQRGLVVTNEHVCAGASSITVALADGRELSAELLGADPGHDLAMLEIKAGPLPQLSLGDSDGLMIGETVIAIGNPFGLTHTATVGIVSATGREVPLGRRGETLKDLIQTDAAINPGNSGGPLLNLDGDLVGLNTAIIRGDGLGFAIPSNQIRRIAARLARGGANLDLGLSLAESSRPRKGETGCLVIGLSEGGPAAAAGLKKGDLLRKLDREPVDTLADYEMILASLAPGQPVTAEATREGRLLTFSLAPRQVTTDEALALAASLYGLSVSEKPGRLLLKRPPEASPADRAGLKEGDLLLALGDRQTTGLRDLAEAVLAARFKPAVAVTIQRGRTLYRTTLALHAIKRPAPPSF
jgi:serine protease Do